MLGFSQFSVKALWFRLVYPKSDRVRRISLLNEDELGCCPEREALYHTQFASQVTGPCDNGAYIVHSLAAEVGSGLQRRK